MGKETPACSSPRSPPRVEATFGLVSHTAAVGRVSPVNRISVSTVSGVSVLPDTVETETLCEVSLPCLTVSCKGTGNASQSPRGPGAGSREGPRGCLWG